MVWQGVGKTTPTGWPQMRVIAGVGAVSLVKGEGPPRHPREGSIVQRPREQRQKEKRRGQLPGQIIQAF